MNGNAPDLLKDKVIYEVHLADMLSGSMWRGQFEQKLVTFLDEVRSKDNVILFIDEMHTLVGAGTGGKTDDLEASNILKPALARGEISCIGATTPTEYDSKIKGNPALERRFQVVRMYPPTSVQMKQILPQLIEYYEQLHPVEYTDEFVSELISFCDRELSNKTYPDKLVDVIDFCGARAKMEYFVVPDDIRAFETDLVERAETAEQGELDDEIEELHKMYREWGLQIRDTRAPVTTEHLLFYLKENVLSLLSQELQAEFIKRLKQKVIHEDNIDRFDTALYSVDLKVNYAPNVILVYGEKDSGKSHFLKSVGECLRNCGCEVLIATRFGLNFLSILGEKNSLAKRISYHENPVVILDDVDKMDAVAADIILDGLKTGRLETIDNQIVDLSNVTFILSAGCKTGKNEISFLASDSRQPEPMVSDDILEMAQMVWLAAPNKDQVHTFVGQCIEKLADDLGRHDVRVEGFATAWRKLSHKLVGSGYDEAQRLFNRTVLPLAIKTLKKREKVLDLSNIDVKIGT